jgi:hypothetical protein
MFGSVRTQGAESINIHHLVSSLTPERKAVPTIEEPRMNAYRSLKVFSHVVLGLMLAGIAYASTISVIYWTGISV